MKELWRLFKVFNKSKKTKVKKVAKEKANPVPHESTSDDHEQDTSTVLDSEDPKEISQENDTKRVVLQSFAEIADLHERVKKYAIHKETGPRSHVLVYSYGGARRHPKYMEWYAVRHPILPVYLICL